VGRSVGERHLARAGDEVRDPGHAAALRSQYSLSPGFVIVTVSSRRRDSYRWR
jgi:hypothetical protein